MNKTPTAVPEPIADTSASRSPVEPAGADVTSASRSRVRRKVASLLTSALDLIFPPSCVSCHGLVEPDELDRATRAGDADDHQPRHLCVSCRRRIVIVRAPHCTTCGHPFFGEMAENIGCAHCETLRPIFGEGRTLTLLQGPMRDLVHALKYHRALHVLQDVAALVRTHDHFRGFVRDACLVPVPLHPRKQRDRTFNQAEMLASVFARQVGGAVVQPLLRRVIDTPTQTRLDREERQENLKNAFALAPGCRLEPGRRYVLVDDVFTTGATLNACAAVLRRAGLKTIDVATLGHG